LAVPRLTILGQPSRCRAGSMSQRAREHRSARADTHVRPFRKWCTPCNSRRPKCPARRTRRSAPAVTHSCTRRRCAPACTGARTSRTRRTCRRLGKGGAHGQKRAREAAQHGRGRTYTSRTAVRSLCSPTTAPPPRRNVSEHTQPPARSGKSARTDTRLARARARPTRTHTQARVSTLGHERSAARVRLGLGLGGGGRGVAAAHLLAAHDQVGMMLGHDDSPMPESFFCGGGYAHNI
jgi:hypothetical protein